MSNKKEILIINNISINKEKSFLVLSTNKGFRIYSSITLNPIFKLKTSYINKLCQVKISKLLHESSIIYLVGESLDSFISNNQVVFYDIHTYSIISVVTLKYEIKDVSVKNDNLLILQNNHLLLLDLVSLTKRKVFPYTNPEIIVKFNFSKKEILFPIIKDDGNIRITIYNYSNKCNKVFDVQTDLTGKAQSIYISSSGSMLILISTNGNAIHILDMETYHIIYKLSKGMNENSFGRISLSLKENILALRNDKNKFHFFDLTETVNEQDIERSDEAKEVKKSKSFKRRSTLKNEIIYAITSYKQHFMTIYNEDSVLIQEKDSEILYKNHIKDDPIRKVFYFNDDNKVKYIDKDLTMKEIVINLNDRSYEIFSYKFLNIEDKE